MIPRATYRLQFHKDFRFEHAAALADYFQSLGISHVYASPCLKARVGSMHGYNVVDYSQINPELGGEDGFHRMAQALRARDIGIILDTVPNHMAVGKADNAWWLDVLRNGPKSPFAGYFDIDWDTPRLEQKVFAPFLDGPPEQALEKGDLTLVRENSEFAFAYYDNRFPLRPEDSAGLASGDPPELSRDNKLSLLANQHYVLADWREADSRINWRRFFDITELAALRMENDAAFDAVHAKTLSLYAEGLVDGLRIDHIDGLADPRAYCRKLRGCLAAREPERPRDSTSGPAYLIVEKILADGEALPDDWQIDGTTGYDFMEDVAGLLHAETDGDLLSGLWARTSGRTAAFEPEELRARQEVLNRNFVAQRDAALRAMTKAAPDVPEPDLRSALSQILVHLRCYRTYATGKIDSPAPGSHFDAAIANAKASSPAATMAIDAIDGIIRSKDNKASDAIRRFNQLAAPIAAKSVEDTAFYRYGRLLSRDDVGFDPRVHGLTVEAFHKRVTARATSFPNTMSTTATHDHKRGEDARARLAVLSEIPDRWQARAEEWLGTAPPSLDRGDVYQLLQTLIGAWPFAELTDIEQKAFSEHIAQWSRKFLREAKLRSSWTAPDENYEKAFASFAGGVIDDREFRRRIADFERHITPAAIADSLAQIVLRMTVPGVPDLYQGRERWDFSLVDPDNRRPVDFEIRKAAQGRTTPLVSYPESWRDGQMKQALVSKLLNARRDHADIFANGGYEPIVAMGTRAGHVLAFERSVGSQSMLVAVSLRCAQTLCGHNEIVPPTDWWRDTRLPLRAERPWKDILSETTLSDAPISVGDLFDVLPVAVLIPV